IDDNTAGFRPAAPQSPRRRHRAGPPPRIVKSVHAPSEPTPSASPHESKPAPKPEPPAPVEPRSTSTTSLSARVRSRRRPIWARPPASPRHRSRACGRNREGNRPLGDDRPGWGWASASTVRLKGGEVILGSQRFAARGVPLGAASVEVHAIEPVAAIDARTVPYRRRLLIVAALTLAPSRRRARGAARAAAATRLRRGFEAPAPGARRFAHGPFQSQRHRRQAGPRARDRPAPPPRRHSPPLP